MNLLMLILIALGIAASSTVFRIAWKMTSDELHHGKSEGPGGKKESKDPPGPSENL
jgi:hypothetical protein